MPVIIKRTIKKQRTRNEKMMLNNSTNMKDDIFSRLSCKFKQFQLVPAAPAWRLSGPQKLDRRSNFLLDPHLPMSCMEYARGITL